MTACVRASRHRRRALTLAAAAALIGAPVLAGSAASAGSAATVTFGGGCELLGLNASSQPDAERVSVPAGEDLRFVNELGQPAMLALDGEAAAEVPDGGSADVMFHDGPVNATMQVQCLLDDAAGAVTVDVVPADERPADNPASAGPSPTSTGSGSSDSATGSNGSSGSSNSDGSTGSAPSPSNRAPGGANRDSSGPIAAPGGTPGGEASGAGWPAAPGGPGVPAAPGGSAGAPGAPGDGPSDAAAGDRRPDGADRDRERGSRWELDDPASSGETSLDPANVDAQADDGLAAEQVSRTAGSGPDDGPIGLLALVATVCVVGVSAGAVRALIGSRASRA